MNSFKTYLFNNGYSKNTVEVYSFYAKKYIDFNSSFELFIYKNNLSQNQIKMVVFSMKKYNQFLKINNKPLFVIDEQYKFKINQTQPSYLTIKEANQLLKTKICKSDKYNTRNYLVIRLLLESGIRVSELVSIQISDLYQNKIKIKGKGNKERYVIISNDLYQKLHQLHSLSNRFIFINKDKEPLTRKGIYNIVYQVGKKSQIKKHVTPHVLRHTFATLMLHNNMDIFSVSKLLGHSSIQITQCYLNISLDVVKKHSKVVGLFI